MHYGKCKFYDLTLLDFYLYFSWELLNRVCDSFIASELINVQTYLIFRGKLHFKNIVLNGYGTSASQTTISHKSKTLLKHTRF